MFFAYQAEHLAMHRIVLDAYFSSPAVTSGLLSILYENPPYLLLFPPAQANLPARLQRSADIL